MVKRTNAAQELVDKHAVRVLDPSIGLAQVASASGGFYTVCLAELSCECPDYNKFKTPCKHIQAVQLAPTCPRLTHGMRLAAAQLINQFNALVPVGSSTITAAKLHSCESLATMGKLGGEACFTISMHDPYCSCLGFTLHGTCLHLIAAADVAELQHVISRVPWLGMDPATALEVIPSATTQHPDIEPLTEAVFDYICKVQQQVPASTMARNIATSTTVAKFARVSQAAQADLKLCPAAAQDEFLQQLQELPVRIKSVRIGESLPSTIRQAKTDATKYWNRQANQIKVRALYKARTRKGLTELGKSTRVVAGQQAASLITGVKKVVRGDTAKLPSVQGSGRPTTKVTGIAFGGNWNRGGRPAYGIRSKTALAAATAAEAKAAAAYAALTAAGEPVVAGNSKASYNSRAKAARRKKAPAKPMKGSADANVCVAAAYSSEGGAPMSP
jgi:hypothetical protein